MMDALRPERFRVESRVARALAARRERLASARAPYSPASLEEIRDRLVRFLAARLPFAARLIDLEPLTGGASKQHFLFHVEEPGPQMRRRSLVLRTALAESLGTAPDLQRELEVQRAMSGVVPVPEALCADPDGIDFGA